MPARAEIWAGPLTCLTLIQLETITCRRTFGTPDAFPWTMKLRIPILLALAADAFAQGPAPLKLTLRDAVQLALKQNPRVILANLGVEQSERERDIARSAPLPQGGAPPGEAGHAGA